MLIWEQGREAVTDLLRKECLSEVTPNREHADWLLFQARRNLADAGRICETNPGGAYSLLYDAARMALVAVLENQGLRPTTQGGHTAPYEAVRAQLDHIAGRTIRPFAGMRRTRNDAEYPDFRSPPVTSADAREGLAAATAICELAGQALDRMPAFHPSADPERGPRNA